MKTTEITLESCIDTCNELLRGELSAVETYSQVIDKLDSGAERAALERIRSDHEDSARQLHNHVLSMGGEPATSSGAWGAFARAVEGAAKMLGKSAALKTLEEGEEYGIREYREAVASGEMMDEIKTVIQRELLPRLSEHTRALSGLLAK
jgi:uncharacterized protein (TIGR02284 family)